MAAAQGDVDDQFLCAAMLSFAAVMSEGESAVMFAGEALARMELLADEPGDIGEQAAQIVTMCAEAEAPEVMQFAKVFRDDLVVAKGVIAGVVRQQAGFRLARTNDGRHCTDARRP
jgi:hypothetical protein